MLQVDLRELANGPAETTGELAPDDPLFAGMDVALAEPVVVRGRLQATGEGRFYWHGTLQTVVAGECRRCLTPVRTAVKADVGALFSQERDALDDPDAYPFEPDAVELDVRPAVREELLLAVPRFLECRTDCRGLCPRCGMNLNERDCGHAAEGFDPRLAPLRHLKDLGIVKEE